MKKHLQNLAVVTVILFLSLSQGCGGGDVGGGGDGGGGDGGGGVVGGGGGCTDECGPSGLAQCSGNGYQTCGNYDADSCLEWSAVTACNVGQSCSNGVCLIEPDPNEPTMNVSASNVKVINHAKHAHASLPAGTYTISWKSGGICAGSSCPNAKDYISMFVFVSEDPTKQFYYILQDPGDSFNVTQGGNGNIWAWYLDTNTGDNVGSAVISITGQPDLTVTASNVESFSFSAFANHSLSQGSYTIKWKSGGIVCGSNPSEYVSLVVFVSEDTASGRYYYLLPTSSSSFQAYQGGNGNIWAWYMETDSANQGTATISMIRQ